jgi:hypothetical protein
MTLRSAEIDADQKLHGEQLIDELVCSCCPTDVAIAASGPVAVYRDRSEDEVRDIRFARLVGDRWQIGQLVAEDDWVIEACPVNGPKIVANGDFIAVAWFTAANDYGAVRLSLSYDAGNNFSAPIDVANDNVLGRVGLAHLGHQDVAVSWLEQNRTDRARLRVRYFDERGAGGRGLIINDAVRALSVPQMAAVGDQVVLAWTEGHGDANRVVSGRLPIAALRQVQ